MLEAGFDCNPFSLIVFQVALCTYEAESAPVKAHVIFWKLIGKC